MTGVETQTVTTTGADAHTPAPGGDRGLLFRLRVPLVCLAACLLGFVLQFGLGAPGTAVWIGVIVVELIAGPAVHFAGRRGPRTEKAAVESIEPVEIVDPAEAVAPVRSELAEPPAKPATRRRRVKSTAVGAVDAVEPSPPEPVVAAEPSLPEPIDPSSPESIRASPPRREDPSPSSSPARRKPRRQRPPSRPARQLQRRPPEAVAETVPPPQPQAGPASSGRSRPVQNIASAPWRAEIIWRVSGDRAVFQAVARNAAGKTITVAQSAVMAWPPSASESLDDLGRAVDHLEAALLERGWKPLPPGGTWYARRFAWTHEAAPTASAPRAATQTPDVADDGPPAPPPTARPLPSAPLTGAAASSPVSQLPRRWPEGTAELVRCQINWESGYRQSRFVAVMLRPGARRGRTIGASESFKWMLNAPPDWRDPQHLAAVRALRARLIGDGWDEVGDGPAWYARRFVWRRTEAPPEGLGERRG